eukprot:5275014-Pyramimonas_sp.AAC.1
MNKASRVLHLIERNADWALSKGTPDATAIYDDKVTIETILSSEAFVSMYLVDPEITDAADDDRAPCANLASAPTVPDGPTEQPDNTLKVVASMKAAGDAHV